jgi:hypothetical protein
MVSTGVCVAVAISPIFTLRTSVSANRGARLQRNDRHAGRADDATDRVPTCGHHAQHAPQPRFHDTDTAAGRVVRPGALGFRVSSPAKTVGEAAAGSSSQVLYPSVITRQGR